MILLFILFFYGCIVSVFFLGPRGIPTQPPPEVANVSPDPAPAKEPELSLDQTEARRIFEKGEKLMRQAKWAAAGKLFQRATELDPQFQPAYVRLGQALYRQGKYDDSIEMLTRATRIKDEFESNFYLGLAYKAKGAWKPAGDSFIQAIKLNKDQADSRLGDAYYFLGEALKHTGQLKLTIDDLEASVRNNTITPMQRFQLATLCLWAGDDYLAAQHRNVLTKDDENLADQLQRLMQLHQKGHKSS